MKHTTTNQKLRQAENHVRKGAEDIRMQERMVSEMDADGHSSELAKDLLKSFERVQAVHLANCQRLQEALEKEVRMADDKTKTGKADRIRINVNEDYELRDWAKKLSVTPEQLKAAVKKVGPVAAAVAKELGKPGSI
jgi:hypothetical protein